MDTEHGAFEVPDFWRKSAFTLPDAPEATLFTDTQFELPLINHDLAADLRLPDIETFQFGQLEDLSGPEDPTQEDSASSHQPTEPSAQDHDDELWKLDLTQPKETSLRTWEAFTDEKYTESRISCISEAGPRAFDALQDQDTNVLQSAFTLKCLALLGLGRSSALFQWKKEESNFVPTLENVRLSGFSMTAFDSIVEKLSTTGIAFAKLRQFIQDAYANKRPLAARIALATSVQAVLEALDQHLAEHVLNAPSTLQLLACFETPGLLLAEMQELVSQAATLSTDAAILSVVHGKVEQFGHSCSPYHAIHTEILNQVSQPWYQNICRRTGLLHGDLDTVNQDPFEQIGHVPAEDAERIMEITTGLAILKEAAPDHPLLYPTSWNVEQPELDFSSMQADTDRIVEKAAQYERDLLAAIAKYDKAEAKPRRINDQAESSDVSEQLPWDLDRGQQEYFEAVGNRFSQPPTSTSNTSGLRTLTFNLIESEYENEDMPLDLQQNTTTTIQRLQPYLTVQGRLVSGSILRLLLRRFSLREHFDLNYSFHLLSNGLFVHRLTTALFSSTSSSAERSRGKTPNTINLGLRLDSRSSQKWPPASSELRLGLMGVLSDAYGDKNLPGGLSFAIRELSEEDIEKVLDPHSIHALDFLRLRYEATSPLDVIFTDDAMAKYDDCFRVLLGVLRMLHVSTLLRVAAAEKDSIEAIRAFSHEAQHCVAALASYFFDCGVAVACRGFNARLDEIETDLAAEDDEGGYGTKVKIGVQGLRDLHEEMLDTIRARLFLRSRHTRLREAVEGIFGTVLQVQRICIESEGNLDESQIWRERRRLRDQVQGLMEALRDMGRKLGKKKEMGTQDKDDALAAEMLSLKLGGLGDN